MTGPRFWSQGAGTLWPLVCFDLRVTNEKDHPRSWLCRRPVRQRVDKTRALHADPGPSDQGEQPEFFSSVRSLRRHTPTDNWDLGSHAFPVQSQEFPPRVATPFERLSTRGGDGDHRLR